MIVSDYQAHVEKKKAAIPLPTFTGLSVLDVGCDHGYWSFLAARQGAERVVGLERNRDVRGKGFTNLVEQNNLMARQGGLNNCTFYKTNVGKQWLDFGRFDVVMLFSLYHHIYDNCGDHKAIWHWLWRHTKLDGQLLWENPLDDTDSVVRMNVREELRKRYNEAEIMAAASQYFTNEYIGPALHEPNRHVFRFRPKARELVVETAQVMDGARGASVAFTHSDGRRIKEIGNALGYEPFPGSLNLKLSHNFDWDACYYRAQILDVERRGQGLGVPWKPRWCRFYPITIDTTRGHIMRFEGETYRQNFLEVIAPISLREAHDLTNGPVDICYIR